MFQRNAAFIERNGRCGLIHPPSEPFLANLGGSHFDSWFWFHGAVLVGDRLEAFVSLMKRTGPLGWAINFEYAETWIASISTRTGSIESLRPAPNLSTKPLYGFSAANDGDWTYLFGNNAIYEFESLPNYVARVPLGEVDLAPSYWNGTTWTADDGPAGTGPSSHGPPFGNLVNSSLVNFSCVKSDRLFARTWEWEQLVEVKRSCNGSTDSWSGSTIRVRSRGCCSPEPALPPTWNVSRGDEMSSLSIYSGSITATEQLRST